MLRLRAHMGERQHLPGQLHEMDLVRATPDEGTCRDCMSFTVSQRVVGLSPKHCRQPPDEARCPYGSEPRRTDILTVPGYGRFGRM